MALALLVYKKQMDAASMCEETMRFTEDDAEKAPEKARCEEDTEISAP